MKKNGFTLIEMLVVVVVIAILAGLVFKMLGAGGTSSDKAKARRLVESMANAVEEYRSEYGRYPPVARAKSGEQPFGYEYPGSIDNWTRGGRAGTENLASQLSQVSRNDATVFIFGLMSYLETRVGGRAEYAHKSLFQKGRNVTLGESHWLSQNSAKYSSGLQREDITSGNVSRRNGWDANWNDAMDNPRDVRAAKKIEPYIKDIRGTWLSCREYNGVCYTNTLSTVIDPWNHQLNYRSDPPYDSYRIWSNGPDGRSGTADDIIAGREN